MTAEEAKVTRIQEALVAGRWFAEDDREALVLPANIADTLGIKPAKMWGVPACSSPAWTTRSSAS
jgi:hypothetical protein